MVATMKAESSIPPRGTAWCLGALVVLLTAFGARAQNLAITGSVIAAGGGTSTNGSLAVTGTIGQPGATTSSGGSYTVEGGFWSIAAAVQTPGAPFLSVVRVGNNVVVSWASPDSAGYVLQQTATVAVPASWAVTSADVSDNGTIKSVTVPAAPGYQFFRLRKP